MPTKSQPLFDNESPHIITNQGWWVFTIEIIRIRILIRLSLLWAFKNAIYSYLVGFMVGLNRIKINT